MSIMVIGGGHSLVGKEQQLMDLFPLHMVVGVNDAALHLPCDYGLSMDRLWTEHRYEEVLKRWPMMHLWARDSAMKNIARVPARLHKFKNDYMSCAPTEDLHTINGSNSGTVALNFALQMKPDRIFLLGFDMQKGPNGEPYWYPPYPWAVPQGGTSPGKYRTWAQEFDEIRRWALRNSVSIINVNHRSAITTFPVWTWERFSAEV